jgi:predicted PurR-regulated permease PerM
MERGPDTLTRLGRFLAFCAAGALALWFLYKLRLVILLVIGSAALAYAIDPLVDFFSRRTPRYRPLGLGLAYLTLFVALALGVVLSLGPLIGEVRALAVATPDYVVRLQDWGMHIATNVYRSLPPVARTQVDQAIAGAGTSLRTLGVALAGRSLGLVSSVTTLLAEVLAMLIMSVFMLADKGYFKSRFFLLVPHAYRADAASLLSQIDAVLMAFVRGQILIAAAVGVIATVGLQLLGVNYALLLGAFTTVTQLIPYIGGLLGMIPAVGLAAFQSLWLALEVLIFYSLLLTFSGNILGPWVVGRVVRINILVIFLATLAGGILGGLVGILLAVPVVGVVKVILDFAYQRLGPRWGLGPAPDSLDVIPTTPAEKADRRAAS